MAEETQAPVAADVTKPVDEPTRSVDAIAEPAVAEAKPSEGGIVATEGVAEVPTENPEEEKPVSAEGNDADTKPEGEATTGEADAPTSNGTPAAKSATNGKRKSGAGLSDNKKKTPAKKVKKAPELRLNAQPGEMYMVAMRGYQPWPVIVCDEEMLPESLLSKRPVSAKRIDGTYREDFLEGAKNAKDRRYPVMFLGTNEFAWQVNTELLNFDLEEVKKDVESGAQGKKNKALWEAYHIAAEGHDLAHFKSMLASHEAAMQEDLEQREQKEQEKQEKKEKASKRKSVAAADSDDVEMEDATENGASAKKAKASKKRKKGDQSDDDNDKPAKTPKTKLKLTTKTPKDASATKPKKESKSKKKTSEEAEPAQPEEPPMTEEERLLKREKQVLYLRHRLQKGFLSRDQAPKDEDMANMSDYLKQLEAHDDLEAEVIKKTKVHKVLKAIVKLEMIPKEEEYEFKLRSSQLLNKWNGALAADAEPATATTSADATTNGVKHDDEKTSEPPKEGSSEPIAKQGDVSSKSVVENLADKDGDVPMSDTGKDASTVPESKADVVSGTKDDEQATASTEIPAAVADVTTS